MAADGTAIIGCFVFGVGLAMVPVSASLFPVLVAGVFCGGTGCESRLPLGCTAVACTRAGMCLTPARDAPCRARVVQTAWCSRLCRHSCPGESP